MRPRRGQPLPGQGPLSPRRRGPVRAGQPPLPRGVQRSVRAIGIVLAAASGLLVGNVPADGAAVIDSGDRADLAILIGVGLLGALFAGLSAAILTAVSTRAAGQTRARTYRTLLQATPVLKQVVAVGQLRRPATGTDRLAVVVWAAGAGGAAVAGLSTVGGAVAAIGAGTFVATALGAAALLPREAPAPGPDAAALLAAALAYGPAGPADPVFAVRAERALRGEVAAALAEATGRAARLTCLAVVAAAAAAAVVGWRLPSATPHQTVNMLGNLPILAAAGAALGARARARTGPARPPSAARAAERAVGAAAARGGSPVPQHRRLAGAVSFRDVTVAGDGSLGVVQGLTLDIAPGERVGLLVADVRAATTLAGLVTWLVPPAAGAVLHDGCSPLILDPDIVWAQVDLVSAAPPLLPGTLRDNLTGAPGADSARLEPVLAVSGLDAVARQLPLGLDTGITMRWWQPPELLALAAARALLRDAAVVVVLDTGCADVPPELFRALAERRTAIVVTTRMAALSGVDLVVEFAGAVPKRTTTFEELLRFRS